jgi:hypothetical protein
MTNKTRTVAAALLLALLAACGGGGCDADCEAAEAKLPRLDCTKTPELCR